MWSGENKEGEFNGGVRDPVVSGNLANAEGAIDFHLGAQFLVFFFLFSKGTFAPAGSANAEPTKRNIYIYIYMVRQIF